MKNLPVNAGDPGSVPGSGKSPGEGNGHPLQSSCLENPINRGAWWAAVYGVAGSRTQLSMCARTHTHTHAVGQHTALPRVRGPTPSPGSRPALSFSSPHLTVHLHPGTARRNLLPYPQHSLDRTLTPGLDRQTSPSPAPHALLQPTAAQTCPP